MAVTGNLSGLNALAARIASQLDGKMVRAGVLKNTPKYEDGTDVALVATVQEYGSPENGIPARPFMRPAIAAHKQEWARLVAHAANAVLKNDGNAQDVLEKVGQKMQGDIQEQIEATDTPPLKESTLRARMYRRKLKKISEVPNTPLRDTGWLVGHINYETDEA